MQQVYIASFMSPEREWHPMAVRAHLSPAHELS